MDRKMEKYKKPNGINKHIHDNYQDSRDAIKKYNSTDLSKISNIDIYFLMDLESYRYKPIPKQILDYVGKKKKRQYHPDISKGPKELYFHVERAIQILSNPRMRDIYDSSYYNTDIPEDRIYCEDEFYDTFNRCFEVYGRFSVNKPVIFLSKDGSTSEFYKFWNSYKTDRTYIPIDEYLNLRTEERQSYTRDNEDKISKMKNEDILKLKKIVALCQKRDPRIHKIEDQISAMKLEKQNEWTEKEIQTLKKFSVLFSKNVKNKWEIITEKLNQATKGNRTLKEVLLQAEKLKLKK